MSTIKTTALNAFNGGLVITRKGDTGQILGGKGNLQTAVGEYEAGWVRLDDNDVVEVDTDERVQCYPMERQTKRDRRIAALRMLKEAQ